MGFSVYAFASAQEFLSSPRLPETSCVIADVQMPGMSGVELQEYLIAHDHGMPVIFITAFPHERVRERAMKGGAVCFLSKPFDEPHCSNVCSGRSCGAKARLVRLAPSRLDRTGSKARRRCGRERKNGGNYRKKMIP